jgi:hypothetical protein
MNMTLQDLFEKGAIIANEISEIIKIAIIALYATDIEVTSTYVLILVLAVLMIFGIRLLSDEIEEFRYRKENESGMLPWYLHNRTLFLAIAAVIIVVYAVIFMLIL